MELLQIQDLTGKFVACAHCQGTSVCQHVVYATTAHTNPFGEYMALIAHLQCQVCGHGPGKYAAAQTVKKGFFKTELSFTLPAWSELQRPVCGMCQGKGFLKLE